MTESPSSALLGPGVFIAVTGASGVGKDALLGEARTQCGGLAVFPRRLITRPPGPGEEHAPLSEAEFAHALRDGQFALSWRAHSLSYGLPASIDTEIAAGRTVVANVSRTVLEELSERYSRVIVVRVTVSDEVRAARLHGRQRESAADVAKRLSRDDPSPQHTPDHEICNDGTIIEGATALARIIQAV